ncbi:XRE family transcriptional regulator [Streptomyces sioyaensis]|uniref:XRE family transcriptional regulator n=1 Tax=Streptomyces sioyaensis TaxID=67364 RepID=UPI001FD5F9C4|nr:XRE family transcriptional regulator [Streptomyces sioyaensis]
MKPGADSNGAQPPPGLPQPDRARTAEEFTAALRALRAWSGLSYRQLEGKAAARGDTLASSTIATALGRATLPREPFVAAFTRACGLGAAETQRWLDARRCLAMAQQPPGPRTGPVPPGADERAASDPAEVDRAPRSRYRHRHLRLIAAAAIGAGAALGAQTLLSALSAPHRTTTATHAVQGLALLAVGSWAQIHPARTPRLCVTEGRDRTHHYATAIAAQYPCAQAVAPRTYVEPVGENLVQIQWHHPKYGIGCLTLLHDGPGRDLIEPRDDCAEDNPAQQFRIEPLDPRASAHFRLRPAATGQCLSVRDQDTVDGAEIVQGRCSGARDQEFLITLIPPA